MMRTCTTCRPSARSRAHWPALDLNRDALSAVSPGYAYVLATVSLVTGPRPLCLCGS